MPSDIVDASRDKPQSEDYQVRKRSLELIQEKGQRFPISAPSIESITNPEARRFVGGGPREGDEA